ncbi:PhoH family protein [Alienimonas sp. DA493]|uniref:PhoH family protein n=1 Tax=Alienimonas sp. DA493 TaxID=3373605 RepID=UPI003754BB07
MSAPAALRLPLAPESLSAPSDFGAGLEEPGDEGPASRPTDGRGVAAENDDATPAAAEDDVRTPDTGPVPKTFVLDTNVILHDSQCLRSFAEHDVAVPMTVLEELDRFKKGAEEKHFHARRFLRELDGLTGELLSTAGICLGEAGNGTKLGRVRVVMGRRDDPAIKGVFTEDTPDHRILAAAMAVHRAEGDSRIVVLVTKDTNLRMKAKALGLIAQDWENDKVESHEALYTGKRIVQHMPSETVDRFYSPPGSVPRDELPEVADPVPNENFILRNGNKSALAAYLPGPREFRRVEKTSAYGIAPRNAEQSFALRALLDDDVRLVTLTGKAGSGKTLLALAAALAQRQKYRQILLARPVVPLSNRDLGFLPGDIGAKLDPYMQPLHDNLSVIRHALGDESEDAKRIPLMLETGKLEISPLAYIRGRSLPRIYFIIDEAQNLTPHEVKTIVTRAGEGTKIVLTGDVKQIDHPYLDGLSNGLSHLIHRMTGQPLYAHVTLEKGERSELAELASDLL